MAPGRRAVFASNAVKLSASEVASTFVEPDYFTRLIRADNAILVGPRGSGKTTLLKMLQSEALEHWRGDAADRAAQIVRSTGVFVGADRLWSEQLSAAELAGKTGFGNAAFALHIGLSLSRAMEYRLSGAEEGLQRQHLRTAISREGELALCASFGDYFRLEKPAFDLAGVRRSIHSRLVDLGRSRNAVMHGAAPQQHWVDVDALAAVRALTEEFNDLANEPDHTWSILFDELELAPPRLLDELLGQLRGGTAHINFKLSLVPVVGQAKALGGEFGAVDGQDVEFISLTDASRVISSRFTKRLFDMHLDSRTPPLSMPVHKLLGESVFDASDAEGAPADLSRQYLPGGMVWEAMNRLRDKDDTFASYLIRSGIDLEDMPSLGPSQRAAKIRKVRNVVVVRDYFRASSRRRSRKSAELYAGASSILALPDGNPRMAMVLIRELIAQWDKRGTNSISRPAQGEAIDVVMDRFVALLSAQEASQIGGAATTVLQLVDLIGRNLAGRILDAPFSADVPACFKIDEAVDERLLPLVERAVNAGALVHVAGTSPSELTSSVVGNTYRLSYLLAPRYGLPIRTGKAVQMSNLLGKFGGLGNESRWQVPLPGFEI